MTTLRILYQSSGSTWIAQFHARKAAQFIYIYRKLKQKQKRINRKKSMRYILPKKAFHHKMDSPWGKHSFLKRFQDLLLINVLMLSFVFCLLCFFYLLIHLSTLIYFNLVAELASDYFLNIKITPFFAGLCETWIKTRSKEFLPYDPVKLMNQPDFADSFVLSSGASEYTAEIKGSPSSSSAITLSSMAGTWLSGPGNIELDSSSFPWPFTGAPLVSLAMVTLSEGQDRRFL